MRKFAAERQRPLASSSPPDDEADVIATADDTIYGLSSSVHEGLRPYLKVKTVILDGRPEGFR